jgi:hypothetical protein
MLPGAKPGLRKKGLGLRYYSPALMLICATRILESRLTLCLAHLLDPAGCRHSYCELVGSAGLRLRGTEDLQGGRPAYQRCQFGLAQLAFTKDAINLAFLDEYIFK